MSGAHATNGSGGPFSGEEIRCALERLSWQIVEEPDENEIALFELPGVEKPIIIDLERDNIYYGDPFFEKTAALMISARALRELAGRTRRRAIEDKMLELRTAVMACREHREWSGHD